MTRSTGTAILLYAASHLEIAFRRRSHGRYKRPGLFALSFESSQISFLCQMLDRTKPRRLATGLWANDGQHSENSGKIPCRPVGLWPLGFTCFRDAWPPPLCKPRQIYDADPQTPNWLTANMNRGYRLSLRWLIHSLLRRIPQLRN